MLLFSTRFPLFCTTVAVKKQLANKDTLILLTLHPLTTKECIHFSELSTTAFKTISKHLLLK